MSPPSVCFISSTAYQIPLDPTSEKKFRALAAVGTIFVIGFSTSWKGRRHDESANFILLPRLPGPMLRYLTLLSIGSLVALSLVLRRRVGILVAQSPYEGVAGAWVKLLGGIFGRRVALIVESHGDFEKAPFLQHRFSWPGLGRFFSVRFSQFALRHADAFRAISDATREQLNEWARGKPIEQFPTWTDMDAFLDAGQKKQKTTRGRLLYVGLLIPLKGVDLLIRAFASIAEDFPEAQLLIIGKAEDRRCAQSLAEQTEELGLVSRVVFKDPLPQRELARQMAQAEALVLPSRSEGLGRVVFEAMACGTPVIGSRVGGIGEMIVDGDNGFLVPTDDSEAVAERLRWLLENPEKSDRMGERARAFAERFFSTESYVDAYRRLFEEATRVTGEKNPTP